MSKNDVPKVYTRTGDKGQTSLIGGTRVSKGEVRLHAYGTVDELNSVLGLLIVEIKDSGLASEVVPLLLEIQSELFDLGSQLACEDEKIRTKLPSVDEARIKEFEEAMDQYSLQLKPLKNFILPGGTRAAALAHIARTVCRRAERISVRLKDADNLSIRYLNRLSDYFFVLARYLNAKAQVEEPIWSARQRKDKK